MQLHKAWGVPLDASFTVDDTHQLGGPSVVFHARAGSGKTRNSEYAPGLVLLIERLRTLGEINTVELASKNAVGLSRQARTLVGDEGAELAPADLAALVRRRAAQAGRKPGAKGSGNGTKRVRFLVSWRRPYKAATIEQKLTGL